VTREDFYQDKHRRIWRHVSRLIEANRPADTLTVHESIEDERGPRQDRRPGLPRALAQNTPSA
jgi:replicative DNA helicase